MSTDINTSHAFVRERTEKTRAVQATLATDASWTWPLKPLAQWDADLMSLDATVNDSLAKVTAGLNVNQLTARGLLDARFDAIHTFTLLAVGVMRVRATTLPGLLQIVNDLSARGDSRRSVEDEADDLLAAWEEWEEQAGAPFVPAPVTDRRPPLEHPPISRLHPARKARLVHQWPGLHLSPQAGP